MPEWHKLANVLKLPKEREAGKLYFRIPGLLSTPDLRLKVTVGHWKGWIANILPSESVKRQQH